MRTRHGHTSRKRDRNGKYKVWKSLTYLSWESMNSRCCQETHKWFDRYGGRGITVCDRWRRGQPTAFINFLADMGERPSKQLTLDRKNNDVGYSKSNCKWSTKAEQRNNQGKSVEAHEPVVLDGRDITLARSLPDAGIGAESVTEVH